jgi:hypothetical protein
MMWQIFAPFYMAFSSLFTFVLLNGFKWRPCFVYIFTTSQNYKLTRTRVPNIANCCDNLRIVWLVHRNSAQVRTSLLAMNSVLVIWSGLNRHNSVGLTLFW